jgi:hypothetical protein
VTAGADTTGGVTLVLTAIGATCLGVVPLAARLIRRAVKAAQRRPVVGLPVVRPTALAPRA